MEMMLLHDDNPQLPQNQSFDANPTRFGLLQFLAGGHGAFGGQLTTASVCAGLLNQAEPLMNLQAT